MKTKDIYVDDDEFCIKDNRIPVLIVIHYGIFPNGCYKGKKDYSKLLGLENQTVGFIQRGYLSYREYSGVIEIFMDEPTLRNIRNKTFKIQDIKWQG